MSADKQSELKSINEMAELLNVSPRTFRRAVKSQQLPFYLIGNSKRFNPAKVLARIEAVERSQDIPEQKVSKKKRVQSSPDSRRFAEMLEIV